MAKILIVEDDPLMSRMYQKIFTFEKYDVLVAHDGEEALTVVQKDKPTLILLDIMMPKMNGLQVLEKLKADATTSAIPVIMLTNLAGQQDADAALSKGAVKYIIKSEHDPKQVSDMVKEILAGYTRNEVPVAAATTTVPLPSSPVTTPAVQSAQPPLPQQTPPPITQQTPSATPTPVTTQASAPDPSPSQTQ